MTQPQDSSSLSPHIVIVGGVAGGASAATRARRMNEQARITMIEKDEHVSFANCGLPYYVGGEITERDKLLLVTPGLFKNRYRIDVMTMTEVTKIDRNRKTVTLINRNSRKTHELGYDKLILAPGASPIVPPMDGANASNVMTLRNVADVDRIKQAVTSKPPRRAVVVGAGYIGLEMVEQLAGLGIEVSLVELQPQILPLMDAEMVQPIEETLQNKGIDLHLGDGIDSIMTQDNLATGVQLSSGQIIDTELVMLGIGVRPNVGLATEAGIELGSTSGVATNDYSLTNDPDIYAVGDVAEYAYAPANRRMRVALAGPANRSGRLAGEHAATGKSQPMAPVMGTSIVRVFEWSACLTGLSISSAERFGVEATSVTVIHNHHVGYYPGASPITLKLIYAPDTGKVLGAQAIGEEGVDKRIDVIATAMRFGATVHDLAGLDLAYAPPFGAAKDPVHMAAFAAMNQLDGHIGVVQPTDDLSSYQVVDVRSATEVAKKPLSAAEHAIHIPLDNLRDRLDELDPSLPTVVSCATGQRSYNAGRILMQNGFEQVFNLTGAATMRSRAMSS